jgi:chemotaxis protein methyltransferase CheR
MIYFDKETRDTLVKKFYDCTRPGGYLFIGHSESLGRDGEYQYVQPAVYRKSE